jgi:hypothetical protein
VVRRRGVGGASEGRRRGDGDAPRFLPSSSLRRPSSCRDLESPQIDKRKRENGERRGKVENTIAVHVTRRARALIQAGHATCTARCAYPPASLCKNASLFLFTEIPPTSFLAIRLRFYRFIMNVKFYLQLLHYHSLN